jgi:head-tail adaptor
MYPDETITPIRAEMARRALPTTAEVLRNSPLSDGVGGVLTEWRISSYSKCRINQSSGNESVQGGVMQARSNWTIRVPIDTDVLPRDRIRVTSGLIEGRVFSVQSVDNGRDNALLLSLSCDIMSDEEGDQL